MAPAESEAESSTRVNSEAPEPPLKEDRSVDEEINSSLEDLMVLNGSTEFEDEQVEIVLESSPELPKHRHPLTNGHAHSPAIRTSSSSPTPRTQPRVKSPQPMRPQFSSDLVTKRTTVNLYA